MHREKNCKSRLTTKDNSCTYSVKNCEIKVDIVDWLIISIEIFFIYSDQARGKALPNICLYICLSIYLYCTVVVRLIFTNKCQTYLYFMIHKSMSNTIFMQLKETSGGTE